MKPTVLLFIVLSSVFFSSCEEQILGPEVKTPPPTVYDSRFATLLDSLRYTLDLPALAGAIITDTGITDMQAIGCRRYGGEKNVTINDRFHLGSNTKAITSLLIAVLIDEGLLNWNTTLPEIFPEFANSMRDEYHDVTILNLLSHSAGLMRDPVLNLKTTTVKEQRLEVVAWTLNQPHSYSRGTYSYSNLGYIIAGAVAEKLTNRTYEELLIEKVLTPLGITSGGFGPMGTPGKEDQPLQHTNSHSPIEPETSSDNHQVYSPAGRLHLAIGDWAKYIQWVLAAEAGHQSLLKAETAKKLLSQVVSDGNGGYYGCGWGIIVQSSEDGNIYTHSGSNGLNYSEALLVPKRGFGVILATNQGPGETSDPLSPATERLLNYYLTGK